MSEQAQQQCSKMERENVNENRIDIGGYFCPLNGDQPWLIELPTVAGVYCPVFKTKEALDDAMRYLKVHKYKAVMIANTAQLYEVAERAGVKICVNPRAYNGVTTWDYLLPHSDGVIVPGT